MKWSTLATALVVIALVTPAVSAAPIRSDDEAGLRATDEAQRRAIAEGDGPALQRIFHPALLVNAPSSRVLTGEQVLTMVGSGDIAAESFERTVENVRITGDLGVVMGRETILPTETSEAGRMFGARPLNRRYSNIYLLENGEWRLIARHANVMPQP